MLKLLVLAEEGDQISKLGAELVEFDLIRAKRVAKHSYNPTHNEIKKCEVSIGGREVNIEDATHSFIRAVRNTGYVFRDDRQCRVGARYVSTHQIFHL